MKKRIYTMDKCMPCPSSREIVDYLKKNGHKAKSWAGSDLHKLVTATIAKWESTAPAPEHTDEGTY
jgi:hypothetical protein